MINRQPKSLTAIAAFICLTWCFVIFLPVNARAQTDEIRQLPPNQTIEREMTGAETHRYQFDLQTGEFFQVRVEQKGVDVALKLLDADNNTLATMDSPNGKEGSEIVSFVADEAGKFILEVGGFDEKAEKGVYTIKREMSRTATASDKQRVAVEKLFVEGMTTDDTEGQGKIALKKLEEALRGWQELKDDYLAQLTAQRINQLKPTKATVIFNEASALFDEGTVESYKAALEKFQEASRLYKETGDKSENSGLSMIGSGLISDRLGKKVEALKYYDKALKFFQEISNKSGEALTLNNIGLVYDDLGEKQKALDYYNQALLLHRVVGDKSGEAGTLTSIGKIYSDLGEKQKALEYLNQALPLRRIVGDKSGEAVTLTGIGVIYFDLNEKQKALDYLRQALSLHRVVGDKSGEAGTLRNIGKIYSDLGEKQKALEYFNQSLPLRRIVGDKSGEAVTLTSVGVVYGDLGEKQKALDYYNQALPIFRAVGDKSGEVTTLNNIGGVYDDLGEKQKALEYFNQALPILKAIGEKQSEAAELSNLMVIWQSLGNRTLAVFYGKQSVNIYQQLRSNIKGLDKSTQQNYLKSIEINYRYLADVMIADGRLLEAQAVLDLLKDEEFAGLLRGGGGETSVPYSNAETVALDALERVAALGREKGELAEKNEKGSLSDAEKQRFREISRQIEIVEAEFDKSLAALSAEKNKGQNFDAVAKDAQAFMSDLKELGRGTVALYTVIINDDKPTIDGKPTAGAGEQIKTGWIILVTPEFRKQYAIDVENLNQTISAFRETLRSDVYDPKPLARTLYAKLFQQKGKDGRTLEADLDEYFKDKPEKTLMWSLDGVLRYVPMAALYDGSDYLVAKYRNTIFTTASKGRLNADVKKNWTVLGLGVSEGREESGKTFPKIDGTKRELDSIVSENDADEGILKGKIELDGQFTAETMRDALDFDKNPVVHIASHFSFDPTDVDGSKSFLLLGKGKLTVKEMSVKSNLFSNVDLLALSACDTAMGSGNGKEVEGFAYVAQSLGAKAVLASLWQVADTGTDELMIRFYELRRKDPQMPKGEAFRRAQLEMLRGENVTPTNPVAETVNAKPARSEIVDLGNDKIKLTRYEKDLKHPFAHPHYWASFVLIGNWR